MGYDIFITRAEDPYDRAGERITETEWRAVAEADSELRYALEDFSVRTVNGVEETSHPWVYEGHSDKPGLWFMDGVITVKSPDDVTTSKLHALAQQLGARVVGQDGEEYGADGNQLGFEEPARVQVPWWRRLFGR